MRSRSAALAASLAIASAPLLAGSAVAADTTLGSLFTPDSPCGAGTVIQTGSQAATYVAPAAGVITSWRLQSGAGATGSATLKVARLVGGVPTVVAAGTPVAVTAGQVTSQSVRIPVLAQDSIGYAVSAGSLCATSTGSPADTYAYAPTDVPVGSKVDAEIGSGYRIPVQATVEPDADNDGYGDTTQDKCPTDATTQAACKDVTAPDTTITAAKAKRLKAQGKKAKAKVSVSFVASEAATFSCSVDGGAYAPCSSPLRLKLTKGKHTIVVRATDAAGNVDATPASTTIKVKRAKPKQ